MGGRTCIFLFTIFPWVPGPSGHRSRTSARQSRSDSASRSRSPEGRILPPQGSSRLPPSEPQLGTRSCTQPARASLSRIRGPGPHGREQVLWPLRERALTSAGSLGAIVAIRLGGRGGHPSRRSQSKPRQLWRASPSRRPASLP